MWDEERTTVAQARAFRNGPALVLRVSVLDLEDVAQRTGEPLAVVYEPVDVPDRHRPGADGHAGIEGLDRAGRPRPEWRALLADVASTAVLVEGPPGLAF